MAYGNVAAGQAIKWNGGRGNAGVSGVFAGETATFEVSHDEGANWVPAGADGILTDAGTFNFNLPNGVMVRWSLAGGAGAGLNLKITGRIPAQ